MPQARNEDRSIDGGQLKRWIQKMQTNIKHSIVNIAMDPVLAQVDHLSIYALYLRTWGILSFFKVSYFP